MKTIQANSIYRLLFFLILAVYCLFTARYGFETWDTGYIPSFSWRIANGQHVYTDFIYKGPPITLYFQAVFMQILPESGQFYFIKIANYLMFSLQVYLTVLSFFNFYKKEILFNKWALMILSLMISLLNFSAYPWPTTDGLFFSVIALYTISKNEKINILKLFWISFLCLLSTFTKQSFYLIPLCFLFGIYFYYGWQKAIIFFLCLIAAFSLFFLWIYSVSSIEAFWDQTSGQTHFKDLLFSGFLDYFWTYPNKIIIFSLLGFSIILLFYIPKKKEINWTEFTKNLALILFLFSLALCFFFEFLIASRVAFLACVIMLINKVIFQKESIRLYIPIILSLSLAWSCSISMGYPFPILFSTGIILSLIVLFKSEIQTIYSSRLFILIGSILCIFAYSYNLKPYREEHFSQLNYSLDKISPKLKYINTSKETFEKLQELKNLIREYGSNYIVAPNFPMTHYVFNTQSVLPADWILNTEVNRNPELFIRLAAKKENFIFLEKTFLEGEEFMYDHKENFSIISLYIYENFKKIGETKYFLLYNTQEKNTPMPTIERRPIH
jgi:hypothetical protein